MIVPGFLRPRDSLTEAERQRGMRGLTLQMVAASGADGLASGGFLTAFALILGASNFHIGIMTAIPFIMQPLQILVVIIVERLRMRKVFAVTSYFLAYAAWVPVALIPLFLEVPHAGAVTVLLFFIAIRGAAIAFLNTSWNSWLRDIVPGEVMGKFFADRTRLATISAAVIGLSAALFIDVWKGQVDDSDAIFGYSIAILFGSVILGMGAVGSMASIPELRMPAPPGPRPSVFKTLSAPLRDKDYRKLVNFLFLWHVVAHLAVPFFAVYMLTRLNISLTIVVGLGVLSQIATVFFLRVWGQIIDQYGSKAVLYVSSSLYFLVILGWVFTTMPDRHALTLPLVLFLHILIGIANAGVGVSMTTMRLQMTPQAQATSYMTASSLAMNLGAGISPLIGGAFADFFAVRQLKFSIEWIDPTRTIDLPAMFLTGYDFLFAVAFVLGIFTLGILRGIPEKGEAKAQVVMDELMIRTRDNMRSLSAVPGLGLMAHFPTSTLRYVPRLTGLDVAVGVTAYQIASSLSAAVAVATQGRQTVAELRHNVSGAISDIIEQAENIGEHSLQAAQELTRETMHVASEAGVRGRIVARAAVAGSLEAFVKAGMEPFSAIPGIVQGALTGADETGQDLNEAVIQAVQGVQDAADRLGISPEEARTLSVQGAMNAVDTLGPEAAAQVQKTLLDSLLAEDKRKRLSD